MAFFDEVLTDRITDEARQIHPGRALLTVLAGLFFAMGWIAAKTFMVAWLALAWTATAVKVGWQEGRKRQAPRRA